MNAREFIEKTQKDFSPNSVRLVGGNLDCERISTQSYSFDKILGGGFPLGRIVEIFGNEGSGKTTLCLHLLAEVQAQGGLPVFIDLENAFLPQYAEDIGIDLEELVFCQPNSGEEAFEIVKSALEQIGDGMCVIVIDSATALAPTDELDGNIGDAKYAPVARLLSTGLRRILPLMQGSNTLLVLTNQMREKVGVIFGKTEDSTGGRALKFYSSVRIQVQRRKTLADSKNVKYGQISHVTVVKNKTAPPLQECEIPLRWGVGIDREKDIFDAAFEAGIIERKGSFYSYEGKNFHGENKFLEAFDGWGEIVKSLKGG